MHLESSGFMQLAQKPLSVSRLDCLPKVYLIDREWQTKVTLPIRFGYNSKGLGNASHSLHSGSVFSGD